MKKIITTIAIAFSLGGYTQNIYTYAGTGTGGFAGNGGQATAAELKQPQQTFLDANGNLYIADRQNDVIRKITSAGVISTVAGTNGNAGWSGDGAAATSAQMNTPLAIALDAAGNMYICDASNQVIRKVNTAGTISTIAGTHGSAGYAGDGAAATSARFNNPQAIALDASGNIYIADANNARIRIISTAGIISTFAGNGTASYSGNGGQATSATINNPTGLAFDPSGNLYIAEYGNNVIRKVTTAGVISTVAGNGTAGFSGDGGQATAAQLHQPYGLAVDAAGNIYESDWANYVVRKVTASTGIINTFAGTPGSGGSTGDGGVATAAKLNQPNGLSVDAAGSKLYISDLINNKIRLVYNPGAALNFNGTANNQINIGTGMNATLGTYSVLTVEAWVNPATISSGSYSEIIGNYSSPAGQMQFLLRQQQNRYIFYIDAGSGYQSVLSPVGTATANIWQHVAGVWDGNNLMIYVNGVLKGTTSGVTGPHLNSSVTNSVVIGYEAAGGGEGFSGNMDEIRVWGRALCGSEIMNNMNAEVKLPQTNLLAYYQFNEGIAGANNSSVTTLADSSGNGYNGTLNAAYALTGTVSNWIAPGAVTTGSYSPSFVGPTVTVNSPTICAGTTATLTASGTTSTYTWSTTATTTSITATPTVTTNYTVTGADANNCKTVKTSTVTVNALPTVTVNSATICIGATATLTANSPTATSYSWNTNATTASITATPTVTTNYTVMVTDANNCMNWTMDTVTVNNLPIVSVNSATICVGATATLTANSPTATSYSWNTNATTASITATPTVTTNYTVMVTDANNCMNWTMDTVTVNNLPIVSVNSATICVGATATLTANSPTATSYSWNTNATTASITATPTVTTNYTVMVTDANNCMNWTMDTVTVNNLPIVSVNSATICVGATATLTANSPTATSYSWNTNATTASITATPTVTTNYTVMVTDANNCMNWAMDTVTVNSLPVINSQSGNVYVCGDSVNKSFTVTSPGSNTYQWYWNSAGVTTGGTANNGTYGETNYNTNNMTVFVTQNNWGPSGAWGMYCVVTNTNNCVSTTAFDTIFFNPKPTVIVNSGAICSGSSFTMSPSGATTYTYSSGTAVVTPTANASYTVTGTNTVTACSNSAISTITVNPTPTVTVNSPTICVGATATLTANGATSYTWSTSATTTSITATPTVSTAYTVTGADANGCKNMVSTSIDVNALPTVTASSSTVTLCVGHTATLTAGGTATSYTWSTGATTPTVAVSPTVTTTYTLTGKNANGCDNMTSFTQSVSTCGVGIEQYSTNNNEVTVYPNPNNGSFVVNTSENTSTILVTDILSNELLSVTPNGTATNINLSAQPSGVYFIKVIADGKQTVKRIIINN